MTVYKVTAKTGFRGLQFGEEFEAELSEDQERRAKERGSIRVVKRDNDNDNEKKGKTDG